jgi:alpha-1,6-mannosyltransferase
MKICDLALYSPETSSGVRTYITNKIAYINARAEPIDHLVVVPAEEEKIVYVGRSRIHYIRGIRTFYPKTRIALNIWKAAKIVQREAPDLIEVNCQFTLPWAAFLATRNHRIPVVGVYHTDIPTCVACLTKSWGRPISSILESLTQFYIGLIYRHFTTTIIASDALTDRLHHLGVRRIERLSRGVDLATFNRSRRDPNFRKRLGMAPGKKILLYVGRLSGEKEIGLLLRAFECLPAQEYDLLIIGEGPETEEVNRYSRFNPAVKYLGHYDSPTDLAAAYASADVFVMPGRYETFGMATVEALACGLPVVGIEGSGSAAIITPQVGALARPGDPRDLARKISVVAGRNGDSIRGDCQELASARYSWDKVFGDYFRIYHRLLGESGLFQNTSL